MTMFQGRKKAYSTAEIAKVPCARCGKPSHHQWQACANGRYFLGICTRCDIALNRMALEFMRIKGRRRLMRDYTKSLK